MNVEFTERDHGLDKVEELHPDARVPGLDR